MEFLLSVFHPDNAISYIFKNYEDYKKWLGVDGYRKPTDEGGSCIYTYHTFYTRMEIKVQKQKEEINKILTDLKIAEDRLNELKNVRDGKLIDKQKDYIEDLEDQEYE